MRVSIGLTAYLRAAIFLLKGHTWIAQKASGELLTYSSRAILLQKPSQPCGAQVRILIAETRRSPRDIKELFFPSFLPARSESSSSDPPKQRLSQEHLLAYTVSQPTTTHHRPTNPITVSNNQTTIKQQPSATALETDLA